MIEKGTIIYHPQYGFGVMKDLPTFGNMQVTGIRSECMTAEARVKQYAKQECANYYKFLNKTNVDNEAIYLLYELSKPQL